MPNLAEITFIVCTYNRADYLDDTLSSLTGAEKPISPVEILVIDNNSEDHTAGVADRYKNMDTPNITVRRIQEENQGLSFARNRGITEAAASVIIFVDDDIRATDQYVNAWLYFFQQHPEVEAAGGKIHVHFDDPRPRWMSHFLLPLLGHHDFGDTIKPYGKTDFPFGGNMAFRTEIFDHIDPFNTKLGRIGKDLKASEEKELFQRVKQAGIDIYYVPRAKLYHRVNAQRLTQEYIRRQAVGLGQSMALQLQDSSFRKKWGTIAAEIGKWGISLGLFIPYVLSLNWHKAWVLLKFRTWIARGYFSFKTQ